VTETETIDATIHQVERLYQSVTGRDAPPAGAQAYAPIPPEKSPEEHVDQQLERLSETLKQAMGQAAPSPRWVPQIGIMQSADELKICVDLPGVAREAVNVSIRHGMLEIAGDRTLQPAKDGERFEVLHAELPRGAFRRLLPLPFPVAPDQIRAQMRDGVLEIRAQKLKLSDVTKTIHVT